MLLLSIACYVRAIMLTIKSINNFRHSQHSFAACLIRRIFVTVLLLLIVVNYLHTLQCHYICSLSRQQPRLLCPSQHSSICYLFFTVETCKYCSRQAVRHLHHCKGYYVCRQTCLPPFFQHSCVACLLRQIFVSIQVLLTIVKYLQTLQGLLQIFYTSTSFQVGLPCLHTTSPFRYLIDSLQLVSQYSP